MLKNDPVDVEFYVYQEVCNTFISHCMYLEHPHFLTLGMALLFNVDPNGNYEL